MDFSQKLDTLQAAEKGFTYTVKDINEEDSDCKITVIGVGSRIFKQAKAKIEAAENRSYKRGKPLPEEESEELWIELLAKCTTAWENVEEDGEQVPFSFDNAVNMYTKYPVLRNQVLGAVHDIKSMLEKK